MLTYSFTDMGSDSMYEYLYKCIKRDILEGKLHPDEKLPSKRTFARNLGISVITVENTYGQLMAEGYIYSLPKKGFYVSRVKDIPFPDTSRTKPGRQFSTTTSPKKDYLADFSSNQTDSQVFPFTIWAKAMREVMSGNQEQLMTNAPSAGIPELRQSIADHLRAFRGMEVSPEQIVVGAGTEYLYSLLIQLLGADITYGLENPGYHKIAHIFERTKVPFCFVDMDKEGVSLQDLEKKQVDVLHISPSHHFPTGIVTPISRRYELLRWASEKDSRFIIEDDYDSELRLSGRPIPTLQSIDISDQVIFMNTFTKTLCSTVRISYMVLPETLVPRFHETLGFYSCTVSNFEQYTLAKFIANGSFEKHLNRLRIFYQNKRDRILEAFRKAPLGDRIAITEKDAGVHFLMKINSPHHEKKIVERALEQGIKLVPISRYYNGEENRFENTFVMNYSSIKVERIEEIAERLYEAMA
ncbi:MAG: PLP-dependent aminotransferase family protein [Eubacterium sp.]|nr:PLP-dependent aminotransferase family protein [Eubacterium sp.]